MRTIVYIEDEPDQRETVKRFLEISGYQVLTVPDVQSGLALVREKRPDLVLLDVFLPDGNGFELCTVIKTDERTQGVPVVIVTASGVEYVDAQAAASGADLCIKKPYELSDLLEGIKNVLEARA